MTATRVLVVEDSLTVRKHIVAVLDEDPDLTVVGEADNGRLAVELCEELRPDVVTLDMVLPIMSGLAAAEYIMAFCPTPIVIVSASTNRGELFKTYEALAAGAVDVLDKPAGDVRDADWERKLTTTVKLAARVKVITHLRARLRNESRNTPRAEARAPTGSRPSAGQLQYVVVGASTGGPQALATIFSALPRDFPLPLMIVIHINPAFGSAFADWLNDQSKVPVRTAGNGEPLPPFGVPCAILAPPDRHLVVRDGRLWLTSDAEVHSCRPSVDVFFESAAREIGDRCLAVLLTGMGRDGARGLLAIRGAGGLTMAQDESTSVVFGMPRAAITLGAAERVLPLGEIGPALVSLARTAEVT